MMTFKVHKHTPITCSLLFCASVFIIIRKNIDNTVAKNKGLDNHFESFSYLILVHRHYIFLQPNVSSLSFKKE